MSCATPEQVQKQATERDYDVAVGRLIGVVLRLRWATVRRDPEVLAEYVQQAKESLAVVETLAAPRRTDVTLYPHR